MFRSKREPRMRAYSSPIHPLASHVAIPVSRLAGNAACMRGGIEKSILKCDFAHIASGPAPRPRCCAWKRSLSPVGRFVALLSALKPAAGSGLELGLEAAVDRGPTRIGKQRGSR